VSVCRAAGKLRFPLKYFTSRPSVETTNPLPYARVCKLSVSKPGAASCSQERFGFPETRIREFAIRDARLRVSVIVVSTAAMAGLSHAAVLTVLNDAAGTELDALSLKQMNFSTETSLKYLYTASENQTCL